MIFCLKIKKYCKLLTNFKTLTALPLLPCECHKCIITYAFAMISIFSVLEKIITLLFEQNKPNIKILLKDTSALYHSESSVEVNSISYGILWNFL